MALQSRNRLRGEHIVLEMAWVYILRLGFSLSFLDLWQENVPDIVPVGNQFERCSQRPAPRHSRRAWFD